jgi:hypothetical protein
VVRRLESEERDTDGLSLCFPRGGCMVIKYFSQCFLGSHCTLTPSSSSILEMKDKSDMALCIRLLSLGTDTLGHRDDSMFRPMKGQSVHGYIS